MTWLGLGLTAIRRGFELYECLLVNSTLHRTVYAIEVNCRYLCSCCINTTFNKNLAIANRSRVSCINTNNNTMTLKSGLDVTQGH